MFFNKFACCSIPYLNFFIEDGQALALNSFGWFTYIVSQVDVYNQTIQLCDLYTAFKHTIHMCGAGHQYM